MQLKRPLCSYRIGQAGFSLSEVLVATGLGLVALASLTAFNRFQLFALQNQAKQIDIQTTARSVVDLFTREVRRAGTNPTCAATGLSAIVAASPYQVRIQADLDGSGAPTQSNEDITYRFNFFTSAVERVDAATGTTETLISSLNVTGSRLRYFDGANPPNELAPGFLGLTAPQRASVRRVRLELALAGTEVDPLNSLPLAARVVGEADLRNRFFIGTMPCPN